MSDEIEEMRRSPVPSADPPADPNDAPYVVQIDQGKVKGSVTVDEWRARSYDGGRFREEDGA